MAEITAALVKELRDKTNAAMMQCKKALTETGGDIEAAADYLRKKGIADSDKKASRDAKEGIIAAHVSDDGQLGALVEVNCETDFVAKNENFQSFVAEVNSAVANSDAADVEGVLATTHGDATVETYVKGKITELGENLVLRRFDRFATQGTGTVASYIHLAGKVGVLIEVGCGSDATVGNDTFKEVVKDLTLHIAAAQPTCINRNEVDSNLVAKEREIFAEQMKDKPANVIDKIIEGKLEKFYATTCLLEQGFVKDPDQSVNDLLAAKGKELDDTLEVRRFARFAVGEEV